MVSAVVCFRCALVSVTFGGGYEISKLGLGEFHNIVHWVLWVGCTAGEDEKEREVDVLCVSVDDFGLSISLEQQAKSTSSQQLVGASMSRFHQGVLLPFPVFEGLTWGQSLKFWCPFRLSLRWRSSAFTLNCEFCLLKGFHFCVMCSVVHAGSFLNGFTGDVELVGRCALIEGLVSRFITFWVWVPLAGQRALVTMAHEGKITCGEGADPHPDTEAVDQCSTSTRKSVRHTGGEALSLARVLLWLGLNYSFWCVGGFLGSVFFVRSFCFP